MDRQTVDKALHKSGMVKEERYTGSLGNRHKVWKSVYLMVDDQYVTVCKRKEGSSVVHHRFPLVEVGTRRVIGERGVAGFALYHGNTSIELRCDGGEAETDKWLSVLTWNAVVASRKAQRQQGGGAGGGGGGRRKRSASSAGEIRGEGEAGFKTDR